MGTDEYSYSTASRINCRTQREMADPGLSHGASCGMEEHTAQEVNLCTFEWQRNEETALSYSAHLAVDLLISISRGRN